MTRLGDPTIAKSPQPSWRLILTAFSIYRRYPLLFLLLAAGVIVPYELIVLAATGVGPFDEESVSGSLSLLLSLSDLVLITPLVSALHVHAVADVRDGEEPALGSVTRRGVQALPMVAAASVMSGLGILVGFAALVVPGIYLTLRWLVVAHAAAIEREGWLPALRRSHRLVSGHYGHVFVFALVVGFISTVPLFLLGLAFDDTDAVSFVVAMVVQVLCLSFAALTTALLYFDLRTRRALQTQAEGIEGSAPGTSAGSGPAVSEHDLDPRIYADEERPFGWYVDPNHPNKMRYWGGDPPAWAQRTTSTPRKIRQEWDGRS